MMYIDTTILMALILSLSVTGGMIVFLRPLAEKIGLLDVPGGRKTHRGSIPLIGGFAIFAGISLSLVINQELTVHQITYLFCAAAIVILGVIDDLYTLTARFRLLCQTGVAIVMYLGAGLYLKSFGNLLGFGEFELGLLGYLLLPLAVIGVINAFNMIDGIDGLLGFNSIISFFTLAILFVQAGQKNELLITLTFIAALIPYLVFNLKIPPVRGKIFMGDAGAMLIGLTLVWLLLHGSQGGVDPQSFRPVTALWIIALPLVDMTSIIIRRLSKGISPFAADREHLHHIFIKAGLSDRKTLLAISALSVIFSGIGLLGEWLRVPESTMFSCFLLLFILYHSILQRASISIEQVQKEEIRGES